MLRGAGFTAVLLLAFALAACGEPPAPLSESALSELVSGPTTQGLCLSARLDPQHGLIRYVVENVGEPPFLYAHGHLGAVLEARRAGDPEWIQLSLRPDAFRILSGMGPIPENLRAVEPGAAMPYDAYLCHVDQRRFTPDEGTPRPGLEVPLADEPFVIDPLDHLWPDSLGDLDRGVLELRVVQVHPDWSELLPEPPWSGRVPSAVLRLRLAHVPAVVRAQMERSSR